MKSWKTTLFGWLSGGGYLFLSALQQGITPKDAAIAVSLGILGTLAKDYDKSNAAAPVPTQKVEVKP